MTELEYTKNGDYYIPNLTYPETKPTYGKYGMMREDYLKNHNSGLWNRLILHGELTEHLNEIDRTARERIDAMMPNLTEAAGVTEELKAADPLKWVGLMNNCKAQAEEIVLSELVYN
ncbi:MAG: TnpV protein [Firmicutes bacterium]|nr:TnpV protein [Bacillota bacterium]